MVKTVKNLPAAQIWGQSLGWEDPLQKAMTIQPNILAWSIPWIAEPGGLQSMGLQRVGHIWTTNTFILSLVKEHLRHSAQWNDKMVIINPNIYKFVNDTQVFEQKFDLIYQFFIRVILIEPNLCARYYNQSWLFHDAQNRGGSAGIIRYGEAWVKRFRNNAIKMEDFSVTQGNWGQKFCFGSGIEKQSVYCREFVKQTYNFNLQGGPER